MALSFVSVVGICIRGTRGGLFSVFGFCASQGRACVRRARGRWNRYVLLVDLVRFFACPAVRGLRLLAQQSEFFAAALRHLVDDSVSSLRVVPVGTGAEGIQPHHPARKYFTAGVLGTHRICLWKIFHPAQGPVQRAESHGGTDYYFPGDAGTFAGAHNVEKMAGQGFTEGSCGNCSARGILMMTSPGLARPNSSRAIFSILRGSVFSSLTSCSSCRFSLFNCSRSVVTFLISSCLRRMAKKPCVPKMSCTRRTSTSSARSARPCWRRKSGMFSPGLVFFSFAEPIVMRLASILRKRDRKSTRLNSSH